MKRFLIIASLVLTLANVGAGVVYACTCNENGQQVCSGNKECYHDENGRCHCSDYPPQEM
jgi:hypothetical protein